MYELWGGGGSPFTASSRQRNNTLRDRTGTPISLMGDVASIWAELHLRDDVLVGVASRCDEPEWGRECLER